MPSVLVVHADAAVRAKLLATLVQHEIGAAALTDLESALDHPEVAAVRVVLADPVLLEQYEFDFRTQIGVRAGSDITVIALVAAADPARKKALKRHEAMLLDRPIEDSDALVAQIRKHSGPVPMVPPAGDPTDPRRPSLAPQPTLGRVSVERVSLDDGTLNAPVGSDGASPMVLIVEDEESSRQFFSTLLEQRGYRVHAVSSATSALRFLGREKSVRLIVSDIDMPQMDGFELKYALKESRIPFIAVAGNDSAERKQLAKELGMVALVGKPVQVKPFCELVRGALLAAEQRT